ncbi:MAG: hypothetical protein NTX50_03425 [Candidatus Sumerlaeota bacterium]|nr:hypothetical protein [Candidatus Sumerlaeota bacterium]
MKEDDLTRELVYESILNASAISKVLRSRMTSARKREKLYVIKGLTLGGLGLYKKGKIIIEEGEGYFYVFISSKTDTDI